MAAERACGQPQGGLFQQLGHLSTRGKLLAEYIFIGGTGTNLHSKTKVLDTKPACVEQLPAWFHDGTSIGLGMLHLQPRAMFPDAFRGGDHILVLCDTVQPPQPVDDAAAASKAQAVPHPSNNRAPCEMVMRAAARCDPRFTFRQQYLLLDRHSQQPLGWRESGPPQLMAGCQDLGSEPGGLAGRELSEAHLRACLNAGLHVSGVCKEDVPGQWSYSLGPCGGIQASDQLWVSRYLLLRVAERFGLLVSTDPKPLPGEWAGSGAFTKFSTRETREADGWFAIQRHVGRLQAAHLQHMVLYGPGNARRLTGQHGTSSAGRFTWAIQPAGASVHIPRSVLVTRRGHYEDRRPASNCDPYLVTMMLVCTTQSVPLPLSRPGLPQGAGPGLEGIAAAAAAAGQPSESELLSRGSSAILDELGRSGAGLSPDTPPQHSLLADCNSQNYDGPRDASF